MRKFCLSLLALATTTKAFTCLSTTKTRRRTRCEAQNPLDAIGEFLESRAAPPDLPPNLPVKGVVITGGANGVGYAYADEFLRRGHRVMICDVRDPYDAVDALKAKHGDAEVFGETCDVSDARSVRQFAKTAAQKLGDVQCRTVFRRGFAFVVVLRDQPFSRELTSSAQAAWTSG
mmetsp:Transcript_24824/g.76664  ORF Transcript_24824/g.76664 Transcript_24824/m.76664 type:complete len:175 (+) Transcript_24824:34-558(+)